MKALLIFYVLWFMPLVNMAQQLLLPAENPFDQISVAGNIHLQLIASNTMQLQFDAATIPEDLNISWDENILSLKTPVELKKTTAIQVKLHYRSLSALEISRGSVVQSADTLKANHLFLSVEGGGKAEFYLIADSLDARVNQGADIILRGSTLSQVITASTGGNFLGYELESGRTWVKASTGAQVKINTSEYLDAKASSKAFVGYMGKPKKKEFKTSLGGEITQQNP